MLTVTNSHNDLIFTVGIRYEIVVAVLAVMAIAIIIALIFGRKRK